MDGLYSSYNAAGKNKMPPLQPNIHASNRETDPPEGPDAHILVSTSTTQHYSRCLAGKKRVMGDAYAVHPMNHKMSVIGRDLKDYLVQSPWRNN